MTTPRAGQGTKILVLHIKVPGIYCDDLPEWVAECVDPDEPTAADYAEVLIDSEMRPEVGLTIVGRPGDKDLHDDFDVHAYTGRIVGAEVRDDPTGGQLGGSS